MAPRKRYSRESVQRALQHHEATGVVTLVSPPGQGQSRFRALAAAERKWNNDGMPT